MRFRARLLKVTFLALCDLNLSTISSSINKNRREVRVLPSSVPCGTGCVRF